MLSTSFEEKSLIFEVLNIHNLLKIEKNKQNEMNVKHSANVSSDNNNKRIKISYNQKVK